MKIEAVTVCVGYHDFLRETAKVNKGLFDQWLIVTEPKDEGTRELCRKLNLRTLLSEDAKRFGEPFNKGRLIERGLHHLSREGWRLHLDADMALPHDFRERLKVADLQEDMIYGIDRIMLQSYEEWAELQKSGYLNGGQFDYHSRQRFHQNKQVGTRWTHPQFGYIPIGFFQLWHSSQDEWRGVRVKPYPTEHGNACRSDVRHAFQWDRHKRALIPEIVGVHLESQPAETGANWNGRTTKPFGPTDGKEDAAWKIKEYG